MLNFMEIDITSGDLYTARVYVINNGPRTARVTLKTPLINVPNGGCYVNQTLEAGTYTYLDCPDTIVCIGTGKNQKGTNAGYIKFAHKVKLDFQQSYCHIFKYYTKR